MRGIVKLEDGTVWPVEVNGSQVLRDAEGNNPTTVPTLVVLGAVTISEGDPVDLDKLPRFGGDPTVRVRKVANADVEAVMGQFT